MPGPAPSPNARRRNARPTFRRLPAAGRRGPVPAWPLSRPTKGELELWEQLWSTPQAVAWDELGWSRTVARYARITVAAEKPRANAAVMAESRQLEDRIGLNPKAMRSLGWDVTAEATAQESGDDADVVDLEAFRSRVG